MENIKIEKITTVTPELQSGLNRLVMHFGSITKQLTEVDITYMVHSQSNKLFIAKNKQTGEIIGMLTLIMYRIPSTKKALIEEIAVDDAYRKKGIGTRLMKEAMEYARQAGVAYVDLTSNPKREIANKFYQHLGFQRRETNVYRLKL